MALPTILVEAATGSDTAASGAGPSTALTGTAAAFAAAVVTLDGTPNLSGVAVDGSHVLYMVTSTGVRFFKITAKDDTLDTVTVTPSPAGTATGRTWAIGGKRASMASASSLLLFDNGGAAGDAMPGWTIQLESGHTETIGAVVTFRRSGDVTDGPITLTGTGTRAVLTYNADSNAFGFSESGRSYIRVNYIDILSTSDKLGAARSACIGPNDNTGDGIILSRLLIRSSNSTNRWEYGIRRGMRFRISLCEINGATTGIYDQDNNSTGRIYGCYIHDCTARGLAMPFAGASNANVIIEDCIFDSNGSHGVEFSTDSSSPQTVAIFRGNTFYNNAGDGLRLPNANGGVGGAIIDNNIFSTNGGYGLNFSGGLSAIAINAYGALVRNNDFNGNVSGPYNPSALVSQQEQTADPTFTNAAAGNFAIGTNLQAKGFPLAGTDPVGGPSGTTTSYVDIGAAQRQEAGGSGGLLTNPGMAGGMRG